MTIIRKIETIVMEKLIMQPKRLYRSKKNRAIAGVCGGLGEYFGIDPIIFRAIFFLVQGFNLVYFVLWIFVPENPNQTAPARGSSLWKKLIIFFLLIFLTVFTFNFIKLFFFGQR